VNTREDARGHHYAVEFAIEVATRKYLDHLPLERQVPSCGERAWRSTPRLYGISPTPLAQVLEPSYTALVG
jgi:hypothetical protein